MTEDERLELEEQYINDIEKVIPTDKAINAILPIFDVFNYGEENPYRTEYNGIIKAFFDEIASGTTYARFLTDGFDSLRDIEFIDGMTEDDISAAISDLERKLKKFSEKLEKEMLQEKAESEKYKNRIDLYDKSIKMALSLVEKRLREIETQIKKIESNIEKLKKNGNFTETINKKLIPKLDYLKILYDKNLQDYTFIKDLSESFNNNILKYIDPIEKYSKLELLTNRKNDLEKTKTDEDIEELIEDLNKELDKINKDYDKKIQETSGKTKEMLKNERDRKIDELTSRVKNATNCLNMSDEDKANYRKGIDDEVDKINDQIEKIDDMSYDKDHKNSKDLFKEMQALVGPLFDEKQVETFGEDGTIKIKKGQSVFNYILKSSDEYNKYGNELEELESKLKDLKIKEDLVEGPLGFFEKKSIAKEKEKIETKIKKLKEKRTMLKKNERIILIKSDNAIKKRNKSIARYEDRANRYYNNKHKLIAKINELQANRLSGIPLTYFENKALEHETLDNKKRAIVYSLLSKASTKPIRISSPSTILMTEKIKIQLKKKKIIRKEKIQNILWQELVLNEIENNSKRNKNIKKDYSVTEDERILLDRIEEIEGKEAIDWSELERIAEEEAKAGKTR